MKPTRKVAFVDCQRKSVGPPIQGDGQALESLLSRYSPVLYRTALRQLHNPEDAEDAVQDALLSALKHIPQFEGRSQISTWLTRIVINSARMLLRRRSRENNISLEQTQEDENLFADQVVDPRPSPEEICQQGELGEILNELLKQLSPLLCRAFQLCEIGALSTSEAAQVLGVTQTAVKSRLFQARAKLSVLLPVAVGTPRPLRTRITEVAQAESAPNQIRETSTCSTRAPPFTLPCLLDPSAPKARLAPGEHIVAPVRGDLGSANREAGRQGSIPMTAEMTAVRPGNRNTDRRLTRRYDLSLPLAAHRVLAKQAEPFTGMTRNISVGGVYFTTDHEFTPGCELDLIFTVPAEIIHGTDVFIQVQGRVVRVETKKTEDGAERVGVAAVIEKYEIVRAKPSSF